MAELHAGRRHARHDSHHHLQADRRESGLRGLGHGLDRRTDATSAVAPTVVGGGSTSITQNAPVMPFSVASVADLSLPVAGWPAHYVLKPGTAWTNTAIDVEMSRHYAGLSAYVAIPPLGASLNDQTTSTVLLP